MSKKQQIAILESKVKALEQKLGAVIDYIENQCAASKSWRASVEAVKAELAPLSKPLPEGYRRLMPREELVPGDMWLPQVDEPEWLESDGANGEEFIGACSPIQDDGLDNSETFRCPWARKITAEEARRD